MNQRLERLLLGDWGPIVRDPIDLVRLNFLLGAGVFAVTGDVTTALRLALSFALVVVARSSISPARSISVSTSV